jgi:hypothetical protein
VEWGSIDQFCMSRRRMLARTLLERLGLPPAPRLTVGNVSHNGKGPVTAVPSESRRHAVGLRTLLT